MGSTLTRPRDGFSSGQGSGVRHLLLVVRAGAQTPVNEGRRGLARFRFSQLQEPLVLGREVASRVCVACIPSDRKGLAPAAAPVNLALIARPAGFVHPPGATEKLKRFRFLPDILEPKIANGIELKPGDGFGGVTWQYLA